MTKEEAGNIISGYEVYGCGYCLQGGDEVEEALRLAVDALRQETVIRCKDCKHWDGYYCHNKWWGDGYGNYSPPIKKESGHCDWAERRKEE